MKIGDSIKVKQGVFSPDYDNLSIGGWQGRIVEIDKNFITFELDSETLSQLNENYIIESIVEEVEWTLLSLRISEVEITQARDSKEDVLCKQNDINLKYSCEEEEKRIVEILNSQESFVTESNLQKYYNYLKDNLKLSCVLTGMEDFEWEEPYLIGGWSKAEYEKKKLIKPSFTDHFELVDFISKIDDWKGIIVKVKRLSDDKVFELPLWDLKIIDKDSSDYLLVSDYSSWMTNYQ